MDLSFILVRKRHRSTWVHRECSLMFTLSSNKNQRKEFLSSSKHRLFQCPAIDYTRHTLDGAACLLNSNKYFPSRVSIKESSVAKLGSVCRRVYRIFSHAYFHHRSLFDEYEVSSIQGSTEYSPTPTSTTDPCLMSMR